MADRSASDATGWGAFRERVHGALVHLHDAPALEIHPLAPAARAAHLPPSPSSGRALREEVLAAIDLVGPPKSARGEGRPGRLIRLRYLDGESIEAIQRELAIGRSEYFREHARAIDAIAAVLRDRWGTGSGLGARSSAANPEANRPWQRSLSVPTSFVGRTKELAELAELLRSRRHITLVGTGGVGKTRLALRLAEIVREGSAPLESEVVWFVDLASLGHDSAVDAVVLAALELRGADPGTAVADRLDRSSGLLVLDNCEHVALQCARLIETILRQSQRSRVVATSREPLRVAGETIYPVPSLGRPESDCEAAEHVQHHESVVLFVDRARAIQPQFRVVEQNAPLVAQICRKLDGIPLAIELAAARLRGLSLGQIAARLDDSLRLLTTGERTALPRHQTLRAMIEWSHDLLTPAEQLLFRRLSVFAGGWILDAAELIFGTGEDVLDGLLSLVDKSLVVADVDEVGCERYRLLEVLRQFARERLDASGEAALLAERHARHFAGIVARSEIEALGEGQEAWYDRLDRDADNVRAALAWCVENDVELGLATAGALWRYWYVRGQLAEGSRQVAAALAKSAPVVSAARAKALFAAAQIAVAQGAPRAAIAMAEESVAIRRFLGDTVGVGWSLHIQAHCNTDHAIETRLLAEATDVLRPTGDELGLAWTLLCLANATDLAGQHEPARALYEESLRSARRSGNRWAIATALVGRGNAAARQGAFEDAFELYEEGLALQREIGMRYLSDTLNALGRATLASGQSDLAVERFRESLHLARKHGTPWEASFAIEGFAAVAIERDDASAAAHLLGSVAAMREALASGISPDEQQAFHRRTAQAREAIGRPAFERCWSDGRALGWDAAVRFALALYTIERTALGSQTTPKAPGIENEEPLS